MYGYVPCKLTLNLRDTPLLTAGRIRLAPSTDTPMSPYFTDQQNNLQGH
jgi:hypothetical protein